MSSASERSVQNIDGIEMIKKITINFKYSDLPSICEKDILVKTNISPIMKKIFIDPKSNVIANKIKTI